MAREHDLGRSNAGMSDEAADKPQSKRWIRTILGPLVVIAIAILAARTLDVSKLRAGLALLAPQHVLAVLALSLCHIAGRALRYHRLVAACHPKSYAWTDGVRIFLIGLSAAAVTPARAGDLVKAKLVTPYGLNIGVGTGLVLVERILDLIVVAVYALALSFVVPNDTIRTGAAALLTMVAVFVVVSSSRPILGAVGALIAHPAKRLLGEARFLELKSPLEGMFETWSLVFRSPVRVLTFLVASFAIWLVEFTKLAVLLRLMGQPVSFPVTISSYATSLIAGAVSALPFSEGVVGVTLVALLARAGNLDTSTTSIAVVVDRAASTLPPIFLWIVFALLRKPKDNP
jgi:uncharacterized protein (TIRG00374 family)